jgi:hypothetical protein
MLIVLGFVCTALMLFTSSPFAVAQEAPPVVPITPIIGSLEGIELELQPPVDEAGNIISRPSDPPAPTEQLGIGEFVLGQPEPSIDSPKITPGEITPDTIKVEPPSDIEQPQLQPDNKSLEAEGLNAPLTGTGELEEGDGIMPAAADSWYRIRYEGFEGLWPNSGWYVADGDGFTNGQVYWDDDDYKPYRGLWSAWAAKGGANGVDPNYYYYPHNMRSWMVYGPFDLTNSTDAELLFNYWNQSEAGFDYFAWAASPNGTNFYGYQVSGNSIIWRHVNFDLTNVPFIGNLTGDSSVWIAFYFRSDSTITDDGPFVDEVVLQKYEPASNCPGQYVAEYFANTSLSGNPVIRRCENQPLNQNWGNGSPGSGIGADNFSARWSTRAYFNGGTYTFKATADDGIRVRLDGQPLLSVGWRDQAPTEYIEIRRVTAGYHNVVVEYYERGGGATARFEWYFAPAPVQLTDRDGFHVFTIDLWNPYVSIETVMADDTSTGHSTNREFVWDMVARPPYNTRNPVLAFNADYFGDGHGAEGLTVKNGIRLPNAGTHNGTEWRRSSLSISNWLPNVYPHRTIRIGRQTDCLGAPGEPDNECTSWSPNSDNYYTTVGGGPLFVEFRKRIVGANEPSDMPGSLEPCKRERDPEIGDMRNNYCDNSNPTQWTAVGLSGNRRYMYVLVSKQGQLRTMDQAAATLISMGAYRVIKLDGGPSTQLWYRPNGVLVNTSREIANALVVFIEP